jgi:hypothetical protein
MYVHMYLCTYVCMYIHMYLCRYVGTHVGRNMFRRVHKTVVVFPLHTLVRHVTYVCTRVWNSDLGTIFVSRNRPLIPRKKVKGSLYIGLPTLFTAKPIRFECRNNLPWVFQKVYLHETRILCRATERHKLKGFNFGCTTQIWSHDTKFVFGIIPLKSYWNIIVLGRMSPFYFKRFFFPF